MSTAKIYVEASAMRNYIERGKKSDESKSFEEDKKISLGWWDRKNKQKAQ